VDFRSYVTRAANSRRRSATKRKREASDAKTQGWVCLMASDDRPGYVICWHLRGLGAPISEASLAKKRKMAGFSNLTIRYALPTPAPQTATMRMWAKLNGYRPRLPPLSYWINKEGERVYKPGEYKFPKRPHVLFGDIAEMAAVISRHASQL
jgi:hypothetical protein